MAGGLGFALGPPLGGLLYQVFTSIVLMQVLCLSMGGGGGGGGRRRWEEGGGGEGGEGGGRRRGRGGGGEV